MDIQLKRAYDRRSEEDGQRVLVDGLWPRGVSKQDAAIDLWLKEIAPSAGLRQWFGHDPERWREFRRRYRSQLKTQRRAAALDQLRKLARGRRVTLVYAARDTAHNNAVVIAELIQDPAS